MTSLPNHSVIWLGLVFLSDYSEFETTYHYWPRRKQAKFAYESESAAKWNVGLFRVQEGNQSIVILYLIMFWSMQSLFKSNLQCMRLSWAYVIISKDCHDHMVSGVFRRRTSSTLSVLVETWYDSAVTSVSNRLRPIPQVPFGRTAADGKLDVTQKCCVPTVANALCRQEFQKN